MSKPGEPNDKGPFLSMKVWQVKSDVRRYSSAAQVDANGDVLDFIPDWPYFEGNRIGQDNFRFKFKTDTSFGEAIQGDFINCDPTALMCTEKCLTKIHSVIENDVEILDTELDGKRVHVVNVTRLVDCLVESESDIIRFDHGGVMWIKRHVLRWNGLESVALFQLPQTVRSELFATEAFVEVVQRHNLAGLELEELEVIA